MSGILQDGLDSPQPLDDPTEYIDFIKSFDTNTRVRIKIFIWVKNSDLDPHPYPHSFGSMVNQQSVGLFRMKLYFFKPEPKKEANL